MIKINFKLLVNKLPMDKLINDTYLLFYQINSRLLNDL